jgi:hypothetical protein
MAVPDFKSLTLPVLKEFGDGVAAANNPHSYTPLALDPTQTASFPRFTRI